MYAVIFEVKIKEAGKNEYLEIAAKLREQLTQINGFISIERFQSLVDQNKLLSLSYWESEESIALWKKNLDHIQAQSDGRAKLFEDYRIRVAGVVKDYTMETSDFS